MPDCPKLKILIRLPNWLGDVIMSTAFIDSVKQCYPYAIIDVVIKKELSSITAFIPGLNITYPFSKSEYKGLIGNYYFGKKLRSENYDLFFNLTASLSSLVLCWASRSKKKIGFNKEGGLFFLTNAYKSPKDVHRVDEYVSLLEQFKDIIVAKKNVRLDKNSVVVIPSNRVIINFNSEAESRRMPIEKGRNIINSLTNQFKLTTFTFIGTPKETGFIEEIIAGVNNGDRIENMTGKTDLAGLCDLMKGSLAVLTTDSGPAHLANSLGVPTIALFGAGNEKNTAPYNKAGLTILRDGKLSCEPCVKNVCELYGIPKCMQLLDEQQIITALNVYLSHAQRRSSQSL